MAKSSALFACCVFDHSGVFFGVFFEILQAVLAAEVDIRTVGGGNLDGFPVLVEFVARNGARLQWIVFRNAIVCANLREAKREAKREQCDAGYGDAI